MLCRHWYRVESLRREPHHPTFARKGNHLCLYANSNQLKIQLHGFFSLGDEQYTDPDNAFLGILLEPGLNHHFERYELSIYTGNVQSPLKNSNLQGSSGVVHLFRTEQSEEAEDWVPLARQYEGKRAKVRWRPERVAIFDHHYKHSIILAWGSDELKKRLSDFPETDDDELAFSYNLDSDMKYITTLPSSPSSSAVRF